MHKMLTIISLFCVLPIAFAEENKPLAETARTICEYANVGGGMSKWVTSKQGFSAAVELRVKVTGKDKQRHCLTSWILHLRREKGDVRTVVVAERDDIPEDNEWMQENLFEIEAWSRDGKMVLASQIEVQGDWDETTPIVYDFSSGKHWRIELYPLFKKMIPADCYVLYRALRFSDDGKVVISAFSNDDDRPEGTKPCFEESLWQLDFWRQSIARASVNSSQ